jgi:glutathione S-transferase
MKLYDWKNSYNSRKIRAVAFETDTAVECVEMNMQAGDHKKADYMAKNPNGKVPMLEDGNFTLWESDAICLYLAGRDPSHRLLPTEARQRARVDQWLFWKTAHLVPSLQKVAYERFWKKRFNLGECDEAAVAAAMPDVDRFMKVLDGSLAKAEYIAGDLSVADFCLAAVFNNRSDIGLDISSYPNVVSWLGRVESRPSWKNTASW